MSVVIPVFNDAEEIGSCVRAVMAQQQQVHELREILVVDGGSTDASRSIVAAIAGADPRVRIMDNPERFVPQAMNAAIRAAAGVVIVRVDAHTVIAEDYVDEAIRALAATGADAVAGPMRPRGRTRFGAATAWAISTRWGIGGSRFHLEDRDGESEAAYMGVFPRTAFERFGLYNPTFRRNQDDELTYRFRELGGRVWLTQLMRSTYTPRSDPVALFQQFRGYGRYKPLVLAAHPSGARIRHLIPAVVALAWLVLPAALVSRRVALPAALHFAALVAAAATGRGGHVSDRATALLMMHLGYGLGFLQGVWHLGTGERPGQAPSLRTTSE